MLGPTRFPSFPPLPSSIPKTDILSCAVVPLTTRPLQANIYAHRCPSGTRLGECIRCWWHWFLRLQSRIRKEQTRRMGGAHLVSRHFSPHGWASHQPRVNVTGSYVCNSTFRYILLTVVQALYSYFIEGDIVFVGKRKTLDKRVSALRLYAPDCNCTHLILIDRHRAGNDFVDIHTLETLLTTTILSYRVIRTLDLGRQISPQQGPNSITEGLQCILRRARCTRSGQFRAMGWTNSGESR